MLPGRYRYHEVVEEYNQCNSTNPFSAQAGPSFHLQCPQINTNHTPNLGIQDIINVLLDNCIPPHWIDHTYPYGLAFIDAHYVGSGLNQALFDDIDNEWLTCIRTHAAPPCHPRMGWLVLLFSSRSHPTAPYTGCSRRSLTRPMKLR